MSGDQPQRLLQQRRVLRLVRPRRAPRRVRQHDDADRSPGALLPVPHSYRRLELRDAGQLRGSKGADGDEELRRKDGDLAVEVRTAAGNLLLVRHPVAAALRIAPRKAADHRRDVHAIPELRLTHAESVEPGEDPAPRRIREWTPVHELMRTGR